MPPVTKRWARLGRWNPHSLIHPSDAGVCLSAFLVARQGTRILMGRVHGTKEWPEKGGYPKARAVELEHAGAWLLPATHLLMEESPDRAAKRIARQWAGLRGTPKFVMIQSHTRPASLWTKGAKGNHWDLCFVYELRVRRLPKTRPWWSEMQFFSPSKLRRLNLGRGHRDILEEASYI
jgi:ADP-ribose pyrophosphatase YjhB (NUDIX family)